MTVADMPPYHELLLPALRAVSELGGSASISEITETVIFREGLSEAQQSVLHHDGPGTEIGYRLAWARTEDGTALVTDSAITDNRLRERVLELRADYLTRLRKARKARLPHEDAEPDDAEPSEEPGWKEQLLEQLMSVAPDAFERLARRLLREADFDSVNVTGRSGDGGIDGLGSTGSAWSASRSSSSASATAEASAPAPFATFAAPWPAAATRAC